MNQFTFYFIWLISAVEHLVAFQINFMRILLVTILMVALVGLFARMCSKIISSRAINEINLIS